MYNIKVTNYGDEKYIEKYIDRKKYSKKVKLAQLKEILDMYTIKPKRENRKKLTNRLSY